MKNTSNVKSLPLLSQQQAAFLIDKDPRWIRANIPKPKNCKYDSKVVVGKLISLITKSYEAKIGKTQRQLSKDVNDHDDISRRKKLAETQNVEELLRINRLKVARLEGKLMPVDWVHRWLREAAAELRKPIEIIGRNHPEHKQLILDGLDNAAAKIEEMLSDDQAD